MVKHKRSIGFFFNRWFAQLFCRASLQPFFRHGYKLMLRGMGLLNADGDDVTGETWLLEKLATTEIKLIVDVGANTSVYGYDVLPKSVKLIAFEPNPETFALLSAKQYPKRVELHQVAVGDHNKTISLYDFADDATAKASQPTATLASTNKEVIEQFHGQKSKRYQVKQVTLDSFLAPRTVKHIDLLKIDVEGAELAVLRGAKQLIAKHQIDLIQFEFNEMNVYQRVFLKDFIDQLPNYRFYRLGPNGLLPLRPYRPLTHELFGFQNILAISNRNLHKWLMIFHTADS